MYETMTEKTITAEECFIEALQEITEAKGAFRQDPFEHAKNVIRDMQALAIEVLTRHGIKPRGQPLDERWWGFMVHPNTRRCLQEALDAGSYGQWSWLPSEQRRMHRLAKRGLLEKLDFKQMEPTVFKITKAGRIALKTAEREETWRR
jgi:hypothetical protein